MKSSQLITTVVSRLSQSKCILMMLAMTLSSAQSVAKAPGPLVLNSTDVSTLESCTDLWFDSDRREVHLGSKVVRAEPVKRLKDGVFEFRVVGKGLPYAVERVLVLAEGVPRTGVRWYWLQIDASLGRVTSSIDARSQHPIDWSTEKADPDETPQLAAYAGVVANRPPPYIQVGQLKGNPNKSWLSCSFRIPRAN